MDKKKMAKILYAVSLDLDYADEIEHVEEDIDCIANELQKIDEMECDILRKVLEIIAARNEELEEWFDNLIREEMELAII